MRCTTALSFAAFAAAPFSMAGPPAGPDDAAAALTQPPERVYYDTVLPDGTLTGGSVLLPRPVKGTTRIPAHVEQIFGGFGDAPGVERVDIVVLGDGYLQSELMDYYNHTNTALAAFFAREPFRTYNAAFRTWRVDIISAESGVDHDPTFGILRNTALNMGFWCNGIQRLLCVDVNWAWNYVLNTPWGADQLLCIANSSTYGGAGYTASDTATVAGGNVSASEIAMHEFGHSIGNLADEYWTAGTVYGGPEVPEPNATILTALGMSSFSSKWFRWLGHNDPNFNGLVGAYQGCRNFAQGINRPTNDSLMRTLGRPFNMPSVEALIGEIYAIVRPIDALSHPMTHRLNGTERMWVDTLDLLTPWWWGYQWSLDGQPIAGAIHADLDLATLSITPGRLHRLSVRVVDNTPWVRDPVLRASRMTQDAQWTLCVAVPCYADCDPSTGPGVLDIFDFLCFQNRFANGDPYACDCDLSTGPLVCDIFDFLCFQNQYSAGCGRTCP